MVGDKLPLHFLSKYPRTELAMKETGRSLEELYIWTEIELERLKEEIGDSGG